MTRSHFDVGKDHEAMKGKLLRLTTEQEDGKIFWDETTAWTAPPKVLMTGTDGRQVVYAHPTGSRKAIKELGRGAERVMETEMDYDRYGNQILDANYGIVENGDRSAFDAARPRRAQVGHAR